MKHLLALLFCYCTTVPLQAQLLALFIETPIRRAIKYGFKYNRTSIRIYHVDMLFPGKPRIILNGIPV